MRRGDGVARPELRQAPIPSPNLFGGHSILAIDFETANPSRASPCAVGLCWFAEGRVVAQAYRLIRPPGNRFASFNVAFHGIGPEDVAGQPEFPEVWSEIERHVSGSILLAHNASFDVSVLRGTLDLYGLALPRADYFCTMLAARRVWPDLANHKLDTVAGHLGFSFRHHHAGEDAEACGRIAIGQMQAVGADSLPALAAAVGLQIRPLRLNDCVPA